MRVLISAITFAYLGASLLFGQVVRSAPTLSVCEALLGHEQYAETEIVVVGTFEGWAHGARLRGEGCEDKLKTKSGSWTWPPTIEIGGTQREYEARGMDIDRALESNIVYEKLLRLELARVGLRRATTVRVTYKGVFHTHKNLLDHDGDGFGALNAAPAQLFIIALMDVKVVD